MRWSRNSSKVLSDVLRHSALARGSALLAVCLLALLSSLSGDGECTPSSEGKEATRLYNEAVYLYHHNQLDQAEVLLRKAIPLFEQEASSLDAATASSSASIVNALAQKEKRLSFSNALVSLATLLDHKGEYQEAETLVSRSLAVLKTVASEQTELTKGSLCLLASILEHQHRLSEASDVLRHALELPKGVDPGEDRGETIIRKRREGVLEKEGVLEEQLRIAIRKYEQLLGPNHITVGRGIYRLALLVEAKGNDKEAEALYRRALAIHVSFLGSTHPLIAEFYTHLAAILRNRGDFDGAQSFLKKALGIYEDALRETEPERLTALKNMVMRARIDEDSQPYLQSIIDAEKKTFGPQHPNVARSMRYLAMYQQSQGNYAEAQEILEQTLQIFNTSLGPDHPDTLLTKKNLAGFYDVMGKEQDAIRVCQEILATQEKLYGQDHPAVARTVYTLALYVSKSGDLPAADGYLQRALSMFQSSLGSNHPFIATILDRLAENRIARGESEEAEQFMKKAKEIRAVSAPPEQHDPNTCLMREMKQ